MSRNIIVTGANGSLGSVVVDKLSRSGYQVAAITRESSKIVNTKNVQYFGVDLTNDDLVKKLIDDIFVIYKTIDAVVMTAGGFAMGDFKSTGKKEFEDMLAINFETSFYLARHVLDRMMQQPEGGKFIFIGSKTSLEPNSSTNSIAYSLSKSLLFQLSSLINAVGKDKNIVSCVIAPSIIDTQANREAMPNADKSKWVSPESIADMIEFLCSDKGGPVKDTVIKMF